MSKDPSREIAMKLVYYLVIVKSSGQNYKYFKLKIIIIIIYLHERDSIRVFKTWCVKVPRKKIIKNREEEGGETPVRRVCIRKPIFPAIRGEGTTDHKRSIITKSEQSQFKSRVFEKYLIEDGSLLI